MRIHLAMVWGALALALFPSGMIRADVEWKWDASGRVESVPETASVDISALTLPLTAKASDEGTLNAFSYTWAESAPFRLTGGALGLLLIFR